LFVVVIERLDRDISGVRSGIIGVGSGEEEETNRRRKESTRRDGLFRQ
jgi:ribosomal protein S12